MSWRAPAWAGEARVAVGYTMAGSGMNRVFGPSWRGSALTWIRRERPRVPAAYRPSPKKRCFAPVRRNRAAVSPARSPGTP
ncbi:MAG: hypothetical protein IMZ44_16925 [Planctomycetes bacterium]|nr:hypothetical protein [Planctomycetota bacterium]